MTFFRISPITWRSWPTRPNRGTNNNCADGKYIHQTTQPFSLYRSMNSDVWGDELSTFCRMAKWEPNGVQKVLIDDEGIRTGGVRPAWVDDMFKRNHCELMKLNLWRSLEAFLNTMRAILLHGWNVLESLSAVFSMIVFTVCWDEFGCKLETQGSTIFDLDFQALV